MLHEKCVKRDNWGHIHPRISQESKEVFPYTKESPKCQPCVCNTNSQNQVSQLHSKSHYN
jgi:hypothetical protein